MDSKEMKKAKMILIAVSGHFDSCLSDDCVCSKRIAAALREAREEGYRAGLEHRDKEESEAINDSLDIHYEEGRKAGLEEAAKIAENRCQCPHHISIAYEIRAAKERDNG